MPGRDRAAVDALVAKIELEMLQNGSALALCRYSDEPFNTNAVIAPHWTEIPFHPPTLGMLGATLALLMGAALSPRLLRAQGAEG